jgi:hypothetical protein
MRYCCPNTIASCSATQYCFICINTIWEETGKNLINQMDARFGFAEFRTLDQTKDPSANFGGKRSGRSWQNATIAVLEQVKARYSIDPTRIYVTGNSLDGMETWDVL